LKLQLVRHATLLLDYAGMKILVDPMLSDAGAMSAIQNSPQPRPNPLVPLPFPVEQVLDGVQLVLVTHTHRDHWDDAAIQLVPKDLPLLCQPEDMQKTEAVHFVNASPVDHMKHWSHICITRTPAQHGSGEIARAMAPSSGYVLSSAGEPTLYITGDTIWYDQVAETIKQYSPQVICGECRRSAVSARRSHHDDCRRCCPRMPGSAAGNGRGSAHGSDKSLLAHAGRTGAASRGCRSSGGDS